MKRRRTLAWAALTVVAAIAVAAACSFPSATVLPDDGRDAEPGEGGGDANGGDAGDGAVTDSNVDPTGKNQDATTIPDGGGGKVDAEAGCCDCDGDGVKAEGGSCALRGNDCDDLIKYVYPDAGFVASTQWFSDHQPTFDWDCDGRVTFQYPYGVGACASHTKLSVAVAGGCAGLPEGFVGNPGCGVTDTYVVKCKDDGNPVNGNCSDDVPTESRAQGCR